MGPRYLFDRPDAFDEIASHGGIALFLDFDGTLVPIREKPSMCAMAESTRRVLKRLITDDKVKAAMLSGRSTADIVKRAAMRGVFYVGNHGLDFRGPGLRHTNAKALDARPLLVKAAKCLTNNIRGINGAWVEDKALSVALHFRTTETGDMPVLRKIFKKCAGGYLEPRLLAVIKGKKVIELVPDTPHDKGAAAKWFLNGIWKGRFPIFVGDDRTDESVFKALAGRGVMVRVGRSKNTAAEYYLKGQGEVHRFLVELADRLSNGGDGA